jgi:vanillate O-demethylase monooxygenase subunit
MTPSEQLRPAPEGATHVTWFSPALPDFDLGTCLAATPEDQGLSLPAAHCVTPETELTSHYFVSSARNMRRDDPEVDRYPNDGM